MELYTTASLWKNYNRKAQPLEVTEVSSMDLPSRTIKYVYFNGDPCADGCPRIFAKYMINKQSNGCGVVLMNDVNNVFDDTYSDLLIKCGYNVLVIDYAGKTNSELYTIYPFSLEKANYNLFPNTITELPDNPKQSCWYVWATLMMRGITFLEAQPEIEEGKINIFGVRLGAFQVWKAAYLCKEVACGIALFNSGYIKELNLEGMKEMQYNTCIDNIPYARETAIPVLIETASNADDDSLDYMTDLYLAIKNEKCVFSIGERRNRMLNADQVENIHYYLDYYNLGKNSLPELPVVSVRESEKNLYYDVGIDQSLPLESVHFFVSQGDMPFTYRNWHEQMLTPVSEGAYIAKVDVYAPKERLTAFLTVKYKNSLSVSSEIITKVPFLMKVKAAPIRKSRLLYDASDGVDDWTVLGSGNDHTLDIDAPVIEEGLYGILGITSKTGSLSTFKFGELRYKLEKQIMIQLTAFFESNNRVSFTIEKEVGGGKYAKYYYDVDVKAYQEWLKVNLGAENFRGELGRLETFDGIASLTIQSENKILINSIIWV